VERRLSLEYDQQDFEAQFTRKISLKHNHGTYAVDVSPPSNADPVPIVFATGWCTVPLTYKNAHEIVFQQNRRSISVSYPKRDIADITHDEYPKIHYQKAQILNTALEQLEVEKTDIIAHSQGALTAAVFAAEYSEKVRNVVFVSPGGLMPPSTTLDIMKRYTKKVGKSAAEVLTNIVQREKQPSVSVTVFEALKSYGINPVHAMREAGEIARSDVVSNLEKIKQQGVGIGIIASVDDPLFPFAEIVKNISADAYHLLYPVKGSHNALNSQASMHASFSLSLLQELELRKYATNCKE
jgi:pimeloyl-ACP methyl ester carboxylesterase